MNHPVINFQQVESGVSSPNKNNLARILPFKAAANEIDASFIPFTADGTVLSDFRFEHDKSDRKIIDYLVLGVLSIFIHAALVDHFKKANFEPEEIIEPVKVPPKVQISLVRPQPKPIVQPPPPPKATPKPVQKKAVPLTPQKPKLTPKPVEDLAPTTPQPTTATESKAPVNPAPATAPPVEEKVTEPHAGADYLNNPAPEYPEAAMERGWEGRVLMKVHVQLDGKPDSISVIESSGKKILDDAAISTVNKWSFVPAKRGNTPIAGWVTVPITFNLQN